VAYYALKRLGAVFLILIIMSLVIFLSTHALPKNAAAMILGHYSTPETQAALEHKLGLDQPLPIQYWRWASGVLHGDLGDSLVMNRPVAPILWRALANSAVLAVTTMIVVSIVGLSLGVIAAVWRGHLTDHAIAIFTYLGLAVPEFYWGLVLILIFSTTFHLLPSSGSGSISMGFGRYLSHLVLPVITLTLSLLAHVSRLTRSSMLEALDTNYVKAARARGLPERQVILQHALRNALMPAITVLAQDFGFLIGGIVAVEVIFAYPGLGQLLVYALQRLDLPVMQAAVLMMTATFCLTNLAADLLYGWINPRIRYGGGVG
jgi:peptide/nickel transport system permease protein